MKKAQLFSIVTLLFAILFAGQVNATNYTWTGSGSDSLFSNSSNWSPSGIPGVNDSVSITMFNAYVKLSGDVAIYSYNQSAFTTLDLNGFEISIFMSWGTKGTVTAGKVTIRGIKTLFSSGSVIYAKVNAQSDLIALNGGIFHDSCYFEFVGNVAYNCRGGNIFNAPVELVCNAMSSTTVWQLGNYSGDVFEDNIQITLSGLGMLSLASTDTTFFNGNITVNNTGSESIVFGLSGGVSHLASGKTIEIGNLGYDSNILLLANFNQYGSTSQQLTLTDSATLALFYCNFEGGVTLNAPDILLGLSVFQNSCDITKTSENNNQWYGGNQFYGSTTINHSGTALDREELTLASSQPNIYFDDVVFESDGKMISAVDAGSEFKGNVSSNYKKISFDGGLVKFSGTGTQLLDAGYTLKFDEFTIDKTSGHLESNTSIEVFNTLDLSNGNLVLLNDQELTLIHHALVVNAGPQSFVDGFVRKIGSTSFEFPVGAGSDFRSILMSAPHNSTDTYMARYYNTMQSLGDSFADTTINFISQCSHWSFQRESGYTNLDISFGYDSLSCDYSLGSHPHMAVWGNDEWKDLGNGLTSGGKILINTTSAQGYFAIAYLFPPVTFTWTGDSSTSWSDSSNWSPSFRSPSFMDVVIIPDSTTNNLVLESNQTIRSLYVDGATVDLNGYDFNISLESIIDSANFTGGSLNLDGKSTSINSSHIYSKMSARSGHFNIINSIFDEKVYFKRTESDSIEHFFTGNTFNGPVSFENDYADDFTFLNTGNSIFNGSVTFANLERNVLMFGGNDTSYFNNSIYFDNPRAGIIISGFDSRFNPAGIILLGPGSVIDQGSQGVIGGILFLGNLQQVNADSLSLTLTEDEAALAFYFCHLKGSANFTAPDLLLESNEFDSNVEFTKTGLSYNGSSGGNIYHQLAKFNNSGEGGLELAAYNSDTYYGDAVFINNLGSLIAGIDSNNYFHGDVFADGSNISFSTGYGKSIFTGSSPQVLHGTESIRMGNFTLDKNGDTLTLASPLELLNNMEFLSSNIYTDTTNKISFIGENEQFINGSASPVLSKLVFDKRFNVVNLQLPISVTDEVQFVSGYMITDSVNIITFNHGSIANGAHNGSFVKGPVKKIGSTVFEFPIGKKNVYRPLVISDPAVSTDAFVAEYFNDGQSLSTDIDTLIDILDDCNHWGLSRISGTSNVDIQLKWMDSGCEILDSTDIRLVSLENQQWKSLGHGSFNGDLAEGSISNDLPITEYSYFTVGYEVSHIDYLPNLELCLMPEDLNFSCTSEQAVVEFGTYCQNEAIVFSLSHKFQEYIANSFNSAFPYCVNWIFQRDSVIDTVFCVPYTESIARTFNDSGICYFKSELINHHSAKTLGLAGGDTLYRFSIIANPSPIISGNLSMLDSLMTMDAGYGYTSYVWSSGDSSQQSIINQNGNYTVTVTDANGCRGIGSINVNSSYLSNPNDPEVQTYGQVQVCGTIQREFRFDVLTSNFDFSIIPEIHKGSPTGPLLIPNCIPGTVANYPIHIEIVAIGNNVVQPLTMTSPFVWNMQLLSNTPLPTSINLTYTITIDCSLVPQDLVGQTLYLVTNFAVDNLVIPTAVLEDLIVYPHIVIADPIVLNGSYGQTNYMIFEYENNGDFPANIEFEFSDLSTCAGNGYDIVDVKYLIASATSTPTHNDFIDPYTPNLNVVINNTNSLFIMQEIIIDDCVNTCNNRFVKFKWKCSDGHVDFCDECQQTYLTTFHFNIEEPTFTVTRLNNTPDVEQAWLDNHCAGEDATVSSTDWGIVITNTSTFATIPELDFNLSVPTGLDPTINLLTLISAGSVTVIENCTGCSTLFTPTASSFTATYCSSEITDPISNINVLISELPPGQNVTITFKMYRCSEDDDDLLDIPKVFNQYSYNYICETKCSTLVNPTPVGLNDDLEIVPDGFISGHASSAIDISQNLTYYTPFYNLLADVPHSSLSCPNDSLGSELHELHVNLRGLEGDINDLQLLGYNTGGGIASGILRAKVKFDQAGLVVPPGQILNIVNSDGSEIWNHTPALFHTNNPELCCIIESEFVYYFKFSDLPAGTTFQDFLHLGAFNFSLQGCCSAAPATTYHVEFSLLMNDDCYTTYALNTNGDGLACDGQICPWLPLSTEGSFMNVQCPGCLAPGIISSYYRMLRTSYGYEDANNDRVADQSGIAIDPVNYNEFNLINRDAAVFGDNVEDRLVGYFNPGYTVDFGYTYHNNMTDNSIEFKSLQLWRQFTVIEGNGNMPGYEIESFDFYIDGDGTSTCIDCGEFPTTNLSKETILHLTVSGNDVNHYLDSSNPSEELLFTFHIDDVGSASTSNPPGIFHINNFNGYTEGQYYRLVVRYKICENFMSHSLYSAEKDDTRKEVFIQNTLFLNGDRLTLPITQNKMPNTTIEMAPRTITGSAPNVIDQDWAGDYLFWCELQASAFQFYSNYTFNKTTYLKSSVLDDDCTQQMNISVMSSLGLGDFVRSVGSNTNVYGGYPYGNSQIFPFEYRPPHLLPNQIFLTYNNLEFEFLTGFPNVSVSTILTAPNLAVSTTPAALVFSPSSSGNYSFISIDLDAPNCINDNNISNLSENYYAGDEYLNLTFDLFFKPLTCSLSVVQTVGYPADYSSVSFEELSISEICDPVNGNPIGCSQDFELFNQEWPRFWSLPHPNLNLSFSPAAVTSISEEVCWNFTITNLPSSVGGTTDAFNLFLGVPLDIAFPLSGWSLDWALNGGTPISIQPDPVSGIFEIADEFDLNQTITGTLCTEYECNGSTEFDLKWGWNCDGFPTDLENPAICGLNSSTIQVDDQEINLQSSSFTSNLGSFVLCEDFVISSCFVNLGQGSTKPNTIEFTTPLADHLFLSGTSPVQIKKCNTSTSFDLTPTAIPNQWEISDADLTNIGILDPDGWLAQNDCFCVDFTFTPVCGFKGELPEINLNYQTYCGLVKDQPIVFDDMVQNGTACNDCYYVEKSVEPEFALPGITPVTYTLTVCSDNEPCLTPCPININLHENFPDFFNFTGTNPFGSGTDLTVTLNEHECESFTFSGILSEFDYCNDAVISVGGTDIDAAEACIQVLNNCHQDADVIIPANTHSAIYTGNWGISSFGISTGTPTEIIIDGDFIVNNLTIFNNCIIKVQPGVEIRVMPNVGRLLLINSEVENCTQMWKGIKAHSKSIVYMNNSTIRGAQYGIMALNGSALTLNHSNFEENYVGLYYPFVQAGNTATAHIESCDFTCLGVLPNQYPNQSPVPGVKTFAGILGYRCMINLNHPNSDPNTFVGLSNGIIGKRSDLQIGNCIFDNIQPLPIYNPQTISLSNVNFNGSAIYGSGTNTNYEINQIGFGTTVFSFNNCHYGIFADKIRLISENNWMDNMDYGYRVDHNINEILISNNRLNCFKTGIDLRMNDRCLDMFIFDNDITFGDLTFGNYYGIRVEEMGILNFGPSIIQHNEISFNSGSNSARHGISIQNGLSFMVIENLLNMTDNSVNYDGIALLNCSFASVSCNEINGGGQYDPNSFQAAIRYYLGDNPILSCNDLDLTNNGIFMMGPLGGNTEIMTNKFRNHHVGLRYDPLTITNPQLWRGNEWFNAPTASTGFNALNDNFNSPFLSHRFDDLSPLHPEFNPVVRFPQGWFQYFPGSDKNCEDSQIICEDHEFVNWGEEIFEFDRIVAMDTLINTPFTNQSRWMLQNKLYSKLDNNSALLTDSLMEVFYDSLENTFTGKLKNLNDNINELFSNDTINFESLQQNRTSLNFNNAAVSRLLASMTEALSNEEPVQLYLDSIYFNQENSNLLLASIDSIYSLGVSSRFIAIDEMISDVELLSADSLIEMNAAILNLMYLQTLASEEFVISTSQADILYQIASQCPYVGGNAVMQARALYSVYNSYAEFDDNYLCFPDSVLARNMAESKPKSKTIAYIYPNPAIDEATLVYKLLSDSKGEFKLFNSAGQIIIKFKLESNNSEYKFNIQYLKPGVYHYKIATSNAENIFGKLVIIR